MHPPGGATQALGTAVLAASGGEGGNGGNGGNGWLYDLLTRSGLSPDAARTVNELVVRPLEVLLVVVLAFLAAYLGARAIRRVLRRIGHPAADRIGSDRARARVDTVSALVANVWRFVVVLVAIAIVLAMFGINLTPLLASATVIGATIGFGAQTLIRDYLSGILLTVEDQYGIGDSVQVTNPAGLDLSGVVEDLTLRITRVRDADGIVWFVPNGDVRRLGNVTRGSVRAAVDLPVLARSGEELDRAKRLVSDTASGLSRSPDLPGRVALGLVGAASLVGVADDAASCTLRVAIRTTPEHRHEAECALREACVRALMDAGLWAAPQPG